MLDRSWLCVNLALLALAWSGSCTIDASGLALGLSSFTVAVSFQPAATWQQVVLHPGLGAWPSSVAFATELRLTVKCKGLFAVPEVPDADLGDATAAASVVCWCALHGPVLWLRGWVLLLLLLLLQDSAVGVDKAQKPMQAKSWVAVSCLRALLLLV